MDHVLAQLLHERVFAHLARVESRDASADAKRMVAAWRSLLGVHETTESGACRGCGRRWRKHMCSVWRVAVAYFIRHERRYGDA